MHPWLESLKELFTGERKDADLERELRSHLLAEMDEQLERGLPAEEAQYAARRALGNVPIITEETRASWGWRRFGIAVRSLAAGLRQDLQYAIRGLRKQPAFAGAAVLALALGIGAATTIFSVIQNVLLDPYPMYSQVDRMVGVSIRDVASTRPDGRDVFKTPEFLDYQTEATSFEDVIAGGWEDTLYTTAEGTEQFSGGLVSGNTFGFMGVSAVVGRTVTLDDAKPAAPPVFVMSHKLWAGRFGLDPGIVGQTFVLNGVPTTLVGVMPPRVSKLGVDLWRPIVLDRADPAMREQYFKFQARLKPSVTIEQAEAEMNLIAQRVAALYPKEYPQKFTVKVVGIIDSVVGPFRKTLYTMAGAVGLLLLIACTNVANMLLSRAAGREKEMAVRASLGASRARLVRQLLVESLLLALLGMAVGWGFSELGIKLFVGAIPEGLIPREADIRLNTKVLVFSLAVAAVTAVLFGLAPALRAVKRDVANPLRDSGKGTSGGFRGGRLSSSLVVGEIALSLVLLSSAGLLMRSFINLQTASLGLDPESLLYLRVPMTVGHQKSAAAQQQFLSQVLTRIDTVPGVVSVATTTGFPTFGGFRTEFDLPGISHVEIWPTAVELCSERFFETLGIHVLQGRTFTADDTNGARKVAVVNHLLVERHLGQLDPIGRLIQLKLQNDDGQLEEMTFEIVGVASDAKNQGIQQPPGSEIFLPYSVAPARSRAILVKTASSPLALLESVKREIWSVDRGVGVADSGKLTDYLSRFSYAAPRLGLFVFGAFAVIGLVLVILGVYSLVAYTVSRQTHEIGIRIAIGAGRRDVLRLTLGMGARWMILGVVAGLSASLATGRVLTSQLWEVSPNDPLTLALVVTVVAVAGFCASYFPARRATRVDPMVVLRYE